MITNMPMKEFLETEEFKQVKEMLEWKRDIEQIPPHPEDLQSYIWKRYKPGRWIHVKVLLTNGEIKEYTIDSIEETISG